RPMLGVYISTYDKNGQKGALVDGVMEDSPAEKAELKEGDVIIAVNNTDITSEKQLRDVIAALKVGEEVTVNYLRDGKRFSEKVTLDASKDIMVFKHGFGPKGSGEFFFEGEFDEEAFEEQMERLKDMHFDFDFDFGPNADDNAAFLGVTAGDKTDAGVSLGKVIEGSSAEKMGLKAGDVITKLDGKSVKSFDDLAQVIKAKEAGDRIEVEYLRDGKKGKLNGELGKRDGQAMEKRIMRTAPHDRGANRLTPNVVKEVKVVIELKDCTKEEEAMLSAPAKVDFKKELAVNKIEFAPNPSDGLFNLAFELPEKKSTRVLVFDQMGRKVYEEILNNFDGSYRNRIDISAQQSGVYFLIIAQGENQFSRKIVKQ
ncbi:MAG: PDZ domain-containing protein, partial [Bacteroidetes bacterium]